MTEALPILERGGLRRKEKARAERCMLFMHQLTNLAHPHQYADAYSHSDFSFAHPRHVHLFRPLTAGDGMPLLLGWKPLTAERFLLLL